MDDSSLLVVDDDHHVRMTLKKTLEAAGYAVETAADGQEALQRMQERSFRLVLLDLRLPDLDGLDVLAELQRHRPEIPVVVITAHGSVETALEAVAAGAAGFVEKPFSPTYIRDVVAHALDRDRQTEEVAAAYQQHIREAVAGFEERHLEAAMEHARRALSLDATRPEAFNLMGVFMQVSGKLSEARRFYQSALSLNPGYVPAQKNQANLALPPEERNLSAYWLT